MENKKNDYDTYRSAAVFRYAVPYSILCDIALGRKVSYVQVRHGIPWPVPRLSLFPFSLSFFPSFSFLAPLIIALGMWCHLAVVLVCVPYVCPPTNKGQGR